MKILIHLIREFWIIILVILLIFLLSTKVYADSYPPDIGPESGYQYYIQIHSIDNDYYIVSNSQFTFEYGTLYSNGTIKQYYFNGTTYVYMGTYPTRTYITDIVRNHLNDGSYWVSYTNQDYNLFANKDPQIKIITPTQNQNFNEINRPDLKVEFISDWYVDIDLWRQETDNTWTLVSNLEVGFYTIEDGYEYIISANNMPYVSGNMKIDIRDRDTHVVIKEVLFSYHPTNENLLDIVGFDDGATYSKEPRVKVLKTGSYRVMPVQLYINGVYLRDIPSGIENYDFSWGYNSTINDYENVYKVGDNIIQIRDITGVNILKQKKFILTSWDAPHNDWLDEAPVILPADILKDKFPFCIPWDLYNSIKNLSGTPTAPHWTISFPQQYFIGGGTINIDLSQFEVLAKIIRWGTLLIFIFGLILSTRKLIGA